jgi:HK97 family phage prohead protease
LKPDSIEIPELGKARAKALRYFDAMSRPRPRRDEPATVREPVVLRDSGGHRINRPALQGFACLYNTPLHHDGEYIIFEAGCFSSTMVSAERVGLWIGHDPAQVIAASGLEFDSTLDGLAFRFAIDESGPAGASIRDCLDNSERACVSVGCTIIKSDIRKVAGVDVRYITRASLKEVSLVKQGAVPETFAALVSLDDVEPNLAIEARSARFDSLKVAANVTARCRRIRDALRAL